MDRVARGEHVTITRAGKAVAKLSPIERSPLSAEALVAAWKLLPAVDPGRLRSDIDATLDPRL